MLRYLLILSFLLPLSNWAAQESVEQEEPAAAVENEESLATDSYEDEDTASTQEYGSDSPVYATPTDEVAKLKQELEAMKKEMQALRSSKPTAQQTNAQAAPGQIAASTSQSLDPDLVAVLDDLGVDSSNLQSSMDARNPEEAVAMANAVKTAGTLEVSDVMSEFNQLEGEFKRVYASGDKAAMNAFKAKCVNYISKHETHSSSRSALYFLARILLKTNDLKEAQNSFARVYRGDEQGPHGADSLLGMAATFLKQNNKAAAIKFIEKVKKEYSKSMTEDTKAELTALSQAAGIKAAPAKKTSDVKKADTPQAKKMQTTAKTTKKMPAQAAA